jgi:hypothetical protein
MYGPDQELQGSVATARCERCRLPENLLREGLDMMLSGDVGAGKAILRDTIKRRSASKSSARRLAPPPRA